MNLGSELWVWVSESVDDFEFWVTTLEIRDSLIPSLEQLHEEHGDLLSDLAVSFPDPPPPPAEDRPVSSPPPRGLTYSAADVRYSYFSTAATGHHARNCGNRNSQCRFPFK
ncbi:hypothetical protein Bca52824_064484 [Brassica carinata]|uniref:Uncharacterized protein n=1 Tax=Brassica carinata TaxID=52824 RepID=A0A8X7QGG2_BRACI|nr:hypothetical protein Bca52824_064484 [Brassica carinata]